MNRLARLRSGPTFTVLVLAASGCGLALGVGDFQDKPVAETSSGGGGQDAGSGGGGSGGAGAGGGGPASGEALWARIYGGSDIDWSESVAVDTNGDIVNVFVAKLTKDGEHVWSKSFGEVGDWLNAPSREPILIMPTLASG